MKVKIAGGLTINYTPHPEKPKKVHFRVKSKEPEPKKVIQIKRSESKEEPKRELKVRINPPKTKVEPVPFSGDGAKFVAVCGKIHAEAEEPWNALNRCADQIKGDSKQIVLYKVDDAAEYGGGDWGGHEPTIVGYTCSDQRWQPNPTAPHRIAFRQSSLGYTPTTKLISDREEAPPKKLKCRIKPTTSKKGKIKLNGHKPKPKSRRLRNKVRIRRK